MTQPSAGKPAFHRTTVDRLVADALPVTRLWPVRRQLALWLALCGVILIATSIGRLRTDLAQRLTDPVFLGSGVLLLSAAIVTAMLAFRAAEPGREARYRESLGATLLVTGAIAFALVDRAGAAISPSLLAHEVVRCVLTTVSVAALPLGALLFALGRGAPVRTALAGAQAGAAAFLVAAFQLRLLCPFDERLHLLAVHLAPVGLASMVCAVVCTAWFRRRAAAQSKQILPD